MSTGNDAGNSMERNSKRMLRPLTPMKIEELTEYLKYS